ncbi:histone-lysine N-methyltransferase PR-Set7-like [Musca domestica]|uniref:[histone H4]-lysine(20) N-methyltransferase n=1 Tax=Musca domestica TaxID=7370 RepID=A0ABM3V6C4_MUSDO|nr:histone-lysine N-methyltransferase PR-Set7-like [Musca domestica]XP_058981331.1 histone-lysine N-methyltransferase PR-Set7-like [Musca domestica]XP_058981332.1 histone-lysine N-methyltransferase PR-Set7-like [Musca domestica]XP_058981333.1 histone-lysine N-methyltransferase PR-Set7-like [Musca domestica]XP_058981334.1 histone-lysine N-methyltransferase PR-Set7-like [Musca domestica]XP_058981335.1 histone-lysine N-methyltransferase PR-Set7-like [Musca domestica]
MVRRRTRACANSKAPVELMTNGGSAAAALANAAQLLEEQYFASPKRKDCKVEESACDEGGRSSASSSPTNIQTEDANAHRTKHKSISPNKVKGGINGRTIGVPLATRSQTRTIENFFKANAAKQNKITNYMNGHDDSINSTDTPKTIQQPTLSASVTPPQMTQQQQQHIEQQKRQINGDHNYQQQQHLPPVISRRSLDHIVVPQEFIFDLSEDTNDSEHTDISDEAAMLHSGNDDDCAGHMTNGLDFTTHRSSQRSDSHSSSHSSSNTSGTDNIFLQEPVLTLNVDKSPNQASSIVINKTLEVQPKFSSPNQVNKSLEVQAKFPSPTTLSASVLHGRFNQIVSLNASPTKDPPGSYEKKSMELSCHDYALLMMPENDNSSCDSGVAFHTTVTTTPQCNGTSNTEGPVDGPINQSVASAIASPAVAATNRRRKPATPHRIVCCPSPIKSQPRVNSPAGSPSPRKMASALSPRKSQRHVTTTAMAAAGGGAAVVTAPNKTRRRLNQSPPKEQKSALDAETNRQDDEPVVVIVDDDVEVEDDHDVECENMATNTVDMKLSTPPPPSLMNGGSASKSILNSAKHPTNQQNATNNKGKSTKAHHKTKYTVQRPQHTALKHQAPQPLAATNGNREITDCFPVRRSVRKTKTAVKEEMMRNLEQAILEERCEGLKIAYFEGKGRGIISERRFQRGEFVIEYVGDLISTAEAAEREKRYALDENAGCYMYYFKHKNQQYCIDATEDTGKLGRLVNHSRNGNLVTKIVVVKQKPHLVLIAKDDIEAGEELCYDYGDRSKESLLHHPWLAF